MSKTIRYIVAACLAGVLALGFNAPAFAQAPQGVYANVQNGAHVQENTTTNLDQLIAGWTAPVKQEVPVSNTGAIDPQKVIYLTFDDGPDPKWTPKVLALLDKYKAKATFFEIGRSVITWPELTQEVAKAGQYIGNHSFSHANLTTLDYNGFYAEVSKTSSAVLNALSGTEGLSKQLTNCLRPPYGAANNATYQYMGQAGLNAAFWSIDTLDWQGLSPDQILGNVELGLRNPNLKDQEKIVLMHDGGEQRENSVDGLGLILHEYTLQGYQFAAMCANTGK